MRHRVKGRGLPAVPSHYINVHAREYKQGLITLSWWTSIVMNMRTLKRERLIYWVCIYVTSRLVYRLYACLCKLLQHTCVVCFPGHFCRLCITEMAKVIVRGLPSSASTRRKCLKTTFSIHFANAHILLGVNHYSFLATVAGTTWQISFKITPSWGRFSSKTCD